MLCVSCSCQHFCSRYFMRHISGQLVLNYRQQLKPNNKCGHPCRNSSSSSLVQSRLHHLYKHRPVVKALSMPTHINLVVSRNVLVCSLNRQNNYVSFVSSQNYNCALINTFCPCGDINRYESSEYKILDQNTLLNTGPNEN